MRTAWAVSLVLLFAASSGSAADPAHAQAGRPAAAPVQPQRPAAGALADVVSPTEGEVLDGELLVVVETPPEVGARRYSLEAAYWDPRRNGWVFPGLLGGEFAGGARATRRVPAAELAALSPAATRWQIRVRVTDPPGSWGPWRTFGLRIAPAQAAAESAPSAALPVPQGREAPPGDTATPPTGRPLPSEGPGSTRSSGLPAVQGREAPTGAPAVSPPVRHPAPGTAAPSRPPELPEAQGREAPAETTGPQPAGRQPPAGEAGPARSSELPAVQSRETRRDRPAGPPPLTAAESRSSAPQPAPSPAVAGYLASPGGQTLKLRLWNGIGAVDKKRVYVDGPVDVDWTRKDLTWWFEYRASGSQRGPLKLRWELSKAPFPAWGEWHPVPGFGLTGPVDAAKWFSVDLSPLAPRPAGWAPVSAIPAQSAGVGGPVTAAVPQPAPSSPHLPDLGGAVLPDAPKTKLPPKKPQPPKTATATGSLGAGPAAVHGEPVAPALLSLYLRVAAVDAAGAPTGPASNAVELRFGPQEKPPPFQFEVAWPAVTFAGYRAVRPYDFDWQCWVAASQDWTDPISGQVILPKGTKKNLCAKEDTNLVEDIIDAIGSFAEMLEGFVNWLSHTYASLKSELLSAVAKAIPGCSGSPPCEGALEMGLNAGLAAVGMPPELPDFEQLQAMGEGYLVDMIAQQAAQTGVPFAEDAARAAVKEMIAQGKEAMTSGGSGSSLWIPDLSRQYKPLLVTVRVANPSAKPTTAVYLEVAETGSSRYLPQTLPVPPLAPQESYEIAVALRPADDPAAWMEEFSGAQANPLDSIGTYLKDLPKAQAAHQAWKDKYTAGHVKLQVSLRPQWNPSTGYQVAFQKTCQAAASACLVP